MVDVVVHSCCFLDLKQKDFISICSTVIAGKPHKTKHGFINRPQVAEVYLLSRSLSACIDIHYHVHGGSRTLEVSGEQKVHMSLRLLAY